MEEVDGSNPSRSTKLPGVQQLGTAVDEKLNEPLPKINCGLYSIPTLFIRIASGLLDCRNTFRSSARERPHLELD